jgi:hypothetical protein
MRLDELFEEMDRRGFLRAMGAGAMAAGAAAAGLNPTTAQAGTKMGPSEFGWDKWSQETKKLEARFPTILKRLLAAAGPDANKFRHVRCMAGSVPGNAQAHGDGVISFDVSVFYDLSDDTIAYVMAHEMGHIALNTLEGYKHTTMQQNHKKEYDADIYGVKLAKLAGYNSRLAYGDFDEASKRAKSTQTHPSYQSRVNKVKQQTGIDVATLNLIQHNKQAITNYATASATA